MASTQCLNGSKRAVATSGSRPGARPSSLQSIGRPRRAIPIRPGRSRCRCDRPRFSDPEDVERLVADFHEVHQDIFAVSDPEFADRDHWLERNHSLPHRLAARRTYRAKAAAEPLLGSPGVFLGPIRSGRRRRLRFETLTPDRLVNGPAIVESGFTSVVIDPGAFARDGSGGCLVIDVAA